MACESEAFEAYLPLCTSDLLIPVESFSQAQYLCEDSRVHGMKRRRMGDMPGPAGSGLHALVLNLQDETGYVSHKCVGNFDQIAQKLQYMNKDTCTVFHHVL